MRYIPCRRYIDVGWAGLGKARLDCAGLKTLVSLYCTYLLQFTVPYSPAGRYAYMQLTGRVFLSSNGAIDWVVRNAVETGEFPAVRASEEARRIEQGPLLPWGGLACVLG